MNRRIATWATIAIAVFGLTACSGAPSAPVASTEEATSAPAASAPTTEQTTPAAPETTASGQTLAEACIEPSAKLIEASAELAEAGAALSQGSGTNAKQTVKALSAMADYFGTLAETSKNDEVREALIGIQNGYDKLSDLYNKLLVKKDYSAAADAAKITTELQEALTAFQELCGA